VCILHSLFLHLNNYDAFINITFRKWFAIQKHRSNVQGNEENSNRKPVFNKSVSIKRLSESVNIATVKRLLLKSETETNFQILSIYFFFGLKNVRVGWSETHVFFFGLSFITCVCESSSPFFVIFKAGCEPTPYWW
jgi:hypothetical protein